MDNLDRLKELLEAKRGTALSDKEETMLRNLSAYLADNVVWCTACKGTYISYYILLCPCCRGVVTPVRAYHGR